MTALRREMSVTANNLANMNTPSYKTEKPLFTEYSLPQPDQKDVSYVQDFGLVRDLQVGTLSQTGNPLDIAINGPGYFVVETPNGNRYTRAGLFSLAPNGDIINRQGLPLMDDRGRQFNIPQGTKNISISNDGVISADALNLGKIQLVEFRDERALKKLPDGLYETNQDPVRLREFEVRQGMVEGSNVVAMLELTNMIEVQRAYDGAKQLVDREDERMRTAIRKLSGNNN
jgi:flagellar basal-body rod protein FlgF